MTDASHNMDDKLKSFLKKHNRGQAVKVNASGTRGVDKTAKVLETLNEKWTTIQ